MAANRGLYGVPAPPAPAAATPTKWQGQYIAGIAAINSGAGWGIPNRLTATSAGTAATLTDRCHWFYFYVTDPVTLNGVSMEVTVGSASQTARVGIVAMDTDGQPLGASGLIYQTTLDVGSSGIKAETGLLVPLPAGPYFVLWSCTSGTPQFRYQRMTGGTGNWASTGLPQFHYRASVTSSTPFSNPVPDWASYATSDTEQCYVGLRWS